MRVALILLLVCAAGCKTIQTREEREASKKASRLRPTLVDVPEKWSKHVYGPQGTAAYVHHEQRTLAEGADHVIYWVYDHGFRLIGYFTEYGNTYRLDDVGDPLFVGNHTPDQSVLKLCRGQGPLLDAPLERPPLDSGSEDEQ